MLKVENTEVLGWEHAIRGMRNPMNSWDKSDSIFGCSKNFNKDCLNTNEYLLCENCSRCFIGDNDHNLMKRLVKAGTDHSKFMRMITVYVDITAPLYFWKEFKTYRAGRKFSDTMCDVINSDLLEMDIEMNSCSTMHKIHAKEFTLDDFSHEHLIDNFSECNGIVFEDGINTPKGILLLIIDTLNTYRHWFLETKEKKYWYQMIQLLPTSYNQKRTVQLNYAVLRNMYHARKNHRLPEWRTFCEWIESLPYSELITMKGE